MEWLVGFLLGFVADLFRSVFLPASTEWMNRIIPGGKRKTNRAENILVLETMERLKSLGKDPGLARHIHDNGDDFVARLTNQREAFVDAQIELIDSSNMTQAEMTMEANRRFEVADTQMKSILSVILDSDHLDELHKDQLRKAQIAWEGFRDEQSEYTGLLFSGGTMRPLVYSGEREALTIQRTGQLKAIYEGLLEQRS